MSDWYQIESKSLIVQITSKGAEMKRLFSKDWNRELLWLGNNKIWERSAPVLFPIVGRLKDDEYYLKGKTYKMTQHGFARDMEFKIVECGMSEAEFVLSATQETFSTFPFCFELRVRYKVEDNKVVVSYFVKNKDRQDIFFSMGAHPGFETQNLGHYEIQFETKEKEYFRLQNGLIDWENPHHFEEQIIKPNEILFKKDALILKKIKSRFIDLVDTKRLETIRIQANSPYWGIWGKEKVPFICVEPWFGVGDSLTHDKNFETKNGIITLPMGESFGFSYSIEARDQ